MWSDSETDVDFLNFTGVSDTVAEVILRANGRPVSIGISGSWGIGKTSMLKLTEKSLSSRLLTAEAETGQPGRRHIFLTFNPWLYQGYDDARAALIEAIATKLLAEATGKEAAVARAKQLLKRVNWFRVAGLTALGAAALFSGVGAPGAIGAAGGLIASFKSDGVTEQNLADSQKLADAIGDEADEVLPRGETSPPKEIHDLREDFAQTLALLDATLVVFIDDLDRCLPETAVATLEAFRLFMFIENTAFVVAADDQMIKHAVRRHFDNIPDDRLVTNYFDKLIQVPVRVPPLGTQEVRAYLMLLFLADSPEVDQDQHEEIRAAVSKQLQSSWTGAHVDKSFVESLAQNLQPETLGRLDLAQRLAPLMTTGVGINGNPRLIKRFLNALEIRMSISRAHGVGVSEEIVAKILLLERLGSDEALSELASAVNSSDDGVFAPFAEWEESALKGADLELTPAWDNEFTKRWLTINPGFAGLDLRGAMYVSRDRLPSITSESRLSEKAADLLAALLENPATADSHRTKLEAVSAVELGIIMGRVLEKASAIQTWGAPPILKVATLIAEISPTQADRLAIFLRERPLNQIQAALITSIKSFAWAKPLFEFWEASDEVDTTVKENIKAVVADGHVTK
ncbi:ATPase [Aeromicrobium sp. CFBP 8757]|nr:P-loop NTPase fold protein [Aeromicrobium sp. CFBP 8757]MBD8608671.1 ATPase [Aeromicrobium sp. CFBP 8757]